MTVRVIINGAQGRMGQVAISALSGLDPFQLVASCGRADNLALAIQKHTPGLVIDFTTPECVYNNSKIILSHGVRAIIGTTGLTPQQIVDLQQIARQNHTAGIIAPNFSIGILLMMRFAKMAAPYFPHAEIIEMHHQHKKDAPSGTAILTAEMINQQGLKDPDLQPLTNENGTKIGAVAIHSLRLPGVSARQQVIFSAPGETLTFDHNTQNADVYIPGIRLACQKVMLLDQLIYGLEQFLD